jgi:hypothetical protein
MTTPTLQVAQTILQQLGGRRFVAMTGARHFLGGERMLSFRLPSYFARNGINAVRITLDGSDTYTVEFSKLRGITFTPISKHEGIYCDGLQALFTAETGLATSL